MAHHHRSSGSGQGHPFTKGDAIFLIFILLAIFGGGGVLLWLIAK